eukprot:4178980-Amphidinium_carterae.1
MGPACQSHNKRVWCDIQDSSTLHSELQRLCSADAERATWYSLEDMVRHLGIDRSMPLQMHRCQKWFRALCMKVVFATCDSCLVVDDRLIAHAWHKSHVITTVAGARQLCATFECW